METIPSASSDATTLYSCWREFKHLFPTEQACVEQLRRRLKTRSRCSACFNRISRKTKGARFVKCQFCFRKQWLTAGTFFHRIRQLRPWFAAIFLFERGVSFNAFQFHNLVGIAYSTAFSILKKIAAAAHSAMQEDATVQLPSALFLDVFTKRSRETPARKRPLAEQEGIDQAMAGDDTVKQGEAFSAPGCNELPPHANNLTTVVLAQEAAVKEAIGPTIQDPMENAIYECLSLKPVPYDAICEKVCAPAGQVSAALTMLELSGLVNRLAGDQFVRSSTSATAAAGKQSLDGPQGKIVNELIKYIREKFGGISRKYLQYYISMHWCQINRKHWRRGSLLDLCLTTRSVSRTEIKEYVTPPLVQIAMIEC